MAKKKQKDPANMSFLDHLEDLRWHLVRSVLGILIAATLAFIFKQFIFDVIIFGPKRIDFYTYRVLCDIASFLDFEQSFCYE